MVAFREGDLSSLRFIMGIWRMLFSRLKMSCYLRVWHTQNRVTFADWKGRNYYLHILARPQIAFAPVKQGSVRQHLETQFADYWTQQRMLAVWRISNNVDFAENIPIDCVL
ncbi:hypothetical protein CEXT_351631 [Caerostris extrusa]|uniref:Uncharacterized protein n=1 Tax=Caerostris extrusa TaxID=172846 RepID=A0AAV4T8A1_CAEEX|nr:hypothetical protein CEXT_351631 [Caerostris extrusa]